MITHSSELYNYVNTLRAVPFLSWEFAVLFFVDLDLLILYLTYLVKA